MHERQDYMGVKVHLLRATEARCSARERLGTWSTSVKAESISSSSSTCFRLVVATISSLRPFGGSFFNRTSRAWG